MPSLHHVKADKPTLDGSEAGEVGALQWGETRALGRTLLS